MEQNLENNDWKKEAPTLAGLPVNNPFSVPEGYFEGLRNQISITLYLEELKVAVKNPGFTLPENYFEGLNENINASIATERLKASVLKETTSADNGFAVPINYFDQLQLAVLAKTADLPAKRSETKLIRLWHSSLLKYASAACFVIIASFGVLYFNQQHVAPQNTNSADIATEQMLFDIDEQVIIDHIEATYKEPKSSPVSSSDAALENYILNNFTQSDLVAGL